jgi:hypothetical protein
MSDLRGLIAPGNLGEGGCGPPAGELEPESVNFNKTQALAIAYRVQLHSTEVAAGWVHNAALTVFGHQSSNVGRSAKAVMDARCGFGQIWSPSFAFLG